MPDKEADPQQDGKHGKDLPAYHIYAVWPLLRGEHNKVIPGLLYRGMNHQGLFQKPETPGPSFSSEKAILTPSLKGVF